MLAKILIVEDDTDGAELTYYQLQQAGYDVRIAVDGTDGLRQAYEYQPDLILLDVMLPVMNGWAVCERLCPIADIPIIFLTALNQEKHIIHGLRLGGDDYITKPYDVRELVARIKAVLRRQAMKAPPLSGVFVYDDLKIDFDQRRVIRGDTIITLTALEFKLLSCLAGEPGKSFSHRYLLHRVWGPNCQSSNSLKLYIWYLRQKLERDPTDPKIILTDHGVGYRLSHPQQPS